MTSTQRCERSLVTPAAWPVRCGHGRPGARVALASVSGWWLSGGRSWAPLELEPRRLRRADPASPARPLGRATLGGGGRPSGGGYTASSKSLSSSSAMVSSGSALSASRLPRCCSATVRSRPCRTRWRALTCCAQVSGREHQVRQLLEASAAGPVRAPARGGSRLAGPRVGSANCSGDHDRARP